MKKAFALILICGSIMAKSQDLSSIQLYDRNGFSETISTKERLNLYQKTDFVSSQPYAKVVRHYGKKSILTTYHDNGQIAEYLEVFGGRAHGRYMEWFPSGAVKLDAHLIEGMGELAEGAKESWVFDGISRVWNEAGICVAEIAYNKGRLEGESRYYYDDGALKRIVPHVSGEIDGVIKTYKSGEVISTEQFRDGIREGQTIRLQPPRIDEEYSRGKLIHGYYYDMDDALISIVDEGTGEQAIFEDGHLATLRQITNGLPDGEVKQYTAGGDLSSVYTTKNGMKHGEETLFYPNGKRKLTLGWREGLLHGPTKTWYENGNKESEREMFKNKRHGLCLAWYLDGSIMHIEEYENDTLVKGSYMKRGEKEAVSTVVAGNGIATLFDPEGYLIERVPYEKGSPAPSL